MKINIKPQIRTTNPGHYKLGFKSFAIGVTLRSAEYKISVKLKEKTSITLCNSLTSKIIKEIKSVENQSFSKNFNIDRPITFFKKLQSNKVDFICLLIKNSKNKLIGYSMGYMEKGDPNMIGNIYYLDSVALKKEYRGLGLGTILIRDAFFNIVKGMGYDFLTAYCQEINIDKYNTRQFYEELGFYYVNQFRYGLLMKKNLEII